MLYLSCLMTDESLERIGLEMGGRDHSTIIYSEPTMADTAVIYG